MTPILIIATILTLSVFGIRQAYLRYKKAKLKEQYEIWKKSQQYTLFRILVPKDNEKTPLAAEQFFSALHGIFNESATFQPQISFEIVGLNKFIHFYVRVPTYLRDFVEGQLYAQYPEAEIKESEDYVHLVDSRAVISAELAVTKESVYPFKTFNNFTVDPLAGITGALGNLRAGENLWLQCIVKPVSDNWQDFGVKFVEAKRAGKSLEEPNIIFRLLQEFADFILGTIRTGLSGATSAGSTESTPPTSGEENKPRLASPQEVALKAIEEKITKLGFESKIRIFATAQDEITARSKVESLVGAFKQFNSTNMNGFKLGELESGADALFAYSTRTFDDAGYTLNTEELASIFHLPSASVVTPNIVWTGSKKGEPPADLPIEGRGDEDEITFFGKTNFRNFEYKFGIRPKDRRLHMYTIGKTGTGKSTLLENMIVDDINKGKGVAIVDPHGQTVEHILGQIPQHRIRDVIYFNPADREMPLGFNLLEAVDPDLRSVAASGAVGIFKKLWADSWGPRLEYILRNAILALIETPDANLLGINRLLVDRPYRQYVVGHLTDPVVKQYFETEYENYSPQFRTEAIAPIQNKVGQFLSSKTIRNIIGQAKSSFDVRRIMDEGKILLIDLSTGKIGEDTAALLGSMIITKIQLAAMSRADVHESQRPDFYLYVDEFQNFATDSFATILSEARKYHLNLALTNQFIAQIPEVVRDAIFGNVGTIISFRVGATDASNLVKEFEPVFSANDLVNLDNHHIYTKLSINGVTRPAFSAETLPPFPEISGFRDQVIEFSRNTYGRSEKLVSEEIAIWAQSGRPEHLKAKDEKLRREGLGVFANGSDLSPIEEIQDLRSQLEAQNMDNDGKIIEIIPKKDLIETEIKIKEGYRQIKGKNEIWYIKDGWKKNNTMPVSNNMVTSRGHSIQDGGEESQKKDQPKKIKNKKSNRPLLGPLLIMKDDSDQQDKNNKKDKIDFDELDRLFGRDDSF